VSFFLQRWLPRLQPSCERNVLKSDVFFLQQLQYFILGTHTTTHTNTHTHGFKHNTHTHNSSTTHTHTYTGLTNYKSEGKKQSGICYWHLCSFKGFAVSLASHWLASTSSHWLASTSSHWLASTASH
jgi:hypothetical protein